MVLAKAFKVVITPMVNSPVAPDAEGVQSRYTYDTAGYLQQMNIGQSDAVTIGEYNEQGELMRGYYYSPQNSLGNAPVAIKHNDNGITQTSYYQNDHLNTPQMLTRPNGAIVWQGQYDAFGEVTQTNTQVSNPLRFPGQYQDDETGLHYNWHRYYDNSIGRYVTRDPIGLRGGLNVYGYVEGNPLMYVDPSGLDVIYNGNVLENSQIREALSNLDKSVPGVDVIVTGGDRYRDSNGKIRSSSNHEWIKKSSTKSKHLDGLAADFYMDGFSPTRELLQEHFDWIKDDYPDGHIHGDLRKRGYLSCGDN